MLARFADTSSGDPPGDLSPGVKLSKPIDVREQLLVDEDRAAQGDALLHLMARAARFAGLDQDHRAREAGHDPVACREVPAGRWGAGGEGGDDEVLSRDPVLKLGVMPRVGLVERRADDGDGPAARVHGGFVGRRIDARGQTRDDRETPANQLVRELGRQRSALEGRAPGAHDSDPRVVEQAYITSHVKAPNAGERHALGLERGGLHVGH